MEEAVEICKLRLFLKLAAQVEPNVAIANLGVEPLPDIDFNIRAGNTLVGYGDVPLDVEKRETGVADMKVKRPSRFEQDVGSRGQLSPCALRGRPSEAEAAYGP